MASRPFALMIIALLGAGQSQALILWKDSVVTDWPASHLAAMKSRSTHTEAGRLLQTPEFGGKYPHPAGSMLGVTLLVDFSDNPARYSSDQVREWLNQKGFDKEQCFGSVRDYYLAASNGRFDFQNDVHGWYRAKKPKSYYESLPNMSGSNELSAEVIDAFSSTVDFSKYDREKIGYVDILSIVYAGPALNYSQGLWPHSTGYTRQISNLRGGSLQLVNIDDTYNTATFVHETGHSIFGWPDLYYFGPYCIMATHGFVGNPILPNDYFRADQGWIPVHEVGWSDTGTFDVAPGMAFIFKNQRQVTEVGSRGEGFLWSYVRQMAHDMWLPGSGLLLLHYNQNAIRNNGPGQEHDLSALKAVQADGLTDLQATQFASMVTGPRVQFQAPDHDVMNGSRHPLIRWTIGTDWTYDSTLAGLMVSDIGVPDSTISFRLGFPAAMAPTTGVLEAESSLVVLGVIGRDPSASAGAYVERLDSSDCRVAFGIRRASAGNSGFSVRYSNGSTAKASQILTVSDFTTEIVYPPTGGWNRWDSVEISAPLPAGMNTLAFAPKTGVVRLDALRILGTDPATPVGGGKGEVVPHREGAFLVGPASWEGARLRESRPDGSMQAVSEVDRFGNGCRARLAGHLSGTGIWVVSKGQTMISRGILAPDPH